MAVVLDPTLLDTPLETFGTGRNAMSSFGHSHLPICLQDTNPSKYGTTSGSAAGGVHGASRPTSQEPAHHLLGGPPPLRRRRLAWHAPLSFPSCLKPANKLLSLVSQTMNTAYESLDI